MLSEVMVKQQGNLDLSLHEGPQGHSWGSGWNQWQEMRAKLGDGIVGCLTAGEEEV